MDTRYVKVYETLNVYSDCFRLRSVDGSDEAGPSGLNRTRTSSSGGGVKLHLATDPSDTSEGAVHGYQGNRMLIVDVL